MGMIENLVHWQIIDNRLVRVFVFENFIQCVNFVSQLSEIAEAANHHPDIEIFNYRHVKVSLTTNDAGKKVTQKDFDLALAIENL
jgi:4a-hydroxytetrahydrobiopterin dehydratase